MRTVRQQPNFLGGRGTQPVARHPHHRSRCHRQSRMLVQYVSTGLACSLPSIAEYHRWEFR
jgi:hypothetical protein